MPSERTTPSVIYYGTDSPQPVAKHFRAGPLSLLYVAGEVRYVKFGQREIVRRIYVTLRDKNWATILPHISSLEIGAQDDSFDLTFQAQHHEGEIDFSWCGRVVGDERGVVTFSMEGKAGSSFMQCRIGICVLHPIRGLAGTPCTIEQPDGTSVQREFPFDVSPHQPFTNIQAIKHKVTDGVDATIRFTGGVFETEDQRNWTDGSYKTYSPPLSVPYPSEITRGTQLSQSVSVELAPIQLSHAVQSELSGLSLTVTETPAGRLSDIGFAFVHSNARLTRKQLDRVNTINPTHLRVDLDLSRPDYPSVLESAWAEANSLGTRLEVALTLSNDIEAQLQDLVSTLKMVKPSVRTWLIFKAPENTSTNESLRVAREYLLRYDNRAVIGGGSNGNFVELNRSRPNPSALDFICYSVHPQVHASDNATLIEALDAQGWTVASTKKWAQNRPVFVTPITLRARLNPRHQEADKNGLLSSVDPRQASLFGAAWTLGSLKYLAESGASSVTYFETHGRRGIQSDDYIGELVFPLYHVFADVCEFAGAEVRRTVSSDPLRAEGLTLFRDGKLRFLCANFSEQKESIVVQGIHGRAWLWELNESNAGQAMQASEEFRTRSGKNLISVCGNVKLDLLPYEVARIDVEVGA